MTKCALPPKCPHFPGMTYRYECVIYGVLTGLSLVICLAPLTGGAEPAAQEVQRWHFRSAAKRNSSNDDPSHANHSRSHVWLDGLGEHRGRGDPGRDSEDPLSNHEGGDDTGADLQKARQNRSRVGRIHLERLWAVEEQVRLISCWVKFLSCG